MVQYTRKHIDKLSANVKSWPFFTQFSNKKSSLNFVVKLETISSSINPNQYPLLQVKKIYGLGIIGTKQIEPEQPAQ